MGDRQARPDGHARRARRARRGAREATPLPLNVDSERLYPDDPGGVGETVRLLADAGAAGCSIEDYDPATGRIDDVGPAAERVAAAAGAKGDVVLTARCESHLYGDDDIDDTIARLVAYRDAGADAVYAPGLTDLGQITAVVEAVGVPVNVLALPTAPPVAELESAGVRRVSVGSLLTAAAYGALVTGARELLEEGTSTYATGRVPRDLVERASFGKQDLSPGQRASRRPGTGRDLFRQALLGPARCLVVDAQADEVADRDHPDHRLAVHDGEVPEAAVDHERRRLAGLLVGLDRVGMRRHRLRDGADDAVGGNGAQHVALGEDADEAPAVEDDDGADAALVHPPRGVHEGRVGRDAEDIARHDVGDSRHEAIVQRSSPKVSAAPSPSRPRGEHRERLPPLALLGRGALVEPALEVRDLPLQLEVALPALLRERAVRERRLHGAARLGLVRAVREPALGRRAP